MIEGDTSGRAVAHANTKYEMVMCEIKVCYTWVPRCGCWCVLRVACCVLRVACGVVLVCLHAACGIQQPQCLKLAEHLTLGPLAEKCTEQM